jgi:hypothetical protein
MAHKFYLFEEILAPAIEPNSISIELVPVWSAERLSTKTAAGSTVFLQLSDQNLHILGIGRLNCFSGICKIFEFERGRM